MFDALKSLLPPSVPRHGEKEKSALRRKAASMTSSGNVSVQFGYFATKEDIRNRKKKVFGSAK